MRPQRKVVLAAVVLCIGVGSAFYFRKSPSSVTPRPAAPLFRAQVAATPPMQASTGPAASHLLGRIDSLEISDERLGPVDLQPSASDPEFRADRFHGMSATPPWDEDRNSVGARTASVRSRIDSNFPNAAEISNPRPRLRTHRVSDGDTLTSLALRYLGRSDRYYEIYEANQPQLRTPDVLPIGMLLHIPDGSVAPVNASPAPMVDISSAELRAARDSARVGPSNATPNIASSGARSYRVQANDTLSAIARHFYNDANRYRDVLDANREQLHRPEDLREGMMLTIP